MSDSDAFSLSVPSQKEFCSYCQIAEISFPRIAVKRSYAWSLFLKARAEVSLPIWRHSERKSAVSLGVPSVLYC